MICQYCKKEAEKVSGEVIYPHRDDLKEKWFYYCKPCKAWVGCHRDGKPFGTLAKELLRNKRSRAHFYFDRFWRGSKSPQERRKLEYAWLSKEMGTPVEETHIGLFNIEQCIKVEQICKERIKNYYKYKT